MRLPLLLALGLVACHASPATPRASTSRSRLSAALPAGRLSQRQLSGISRNRRHQMSNTRGLNL